MPLREFRERLYGCLDKRVDALFELIDAVLTSGHVTSPVHLSLASVHRRSWVRFYAALEKDRIDVAAARASSGFGGSFVDNQDALPPPLEAGAECYAGFSSFLYSRMSPG